MPTATTIYQPGASQERLLMSDMRHHRPHPSNGQQGTGETPALRGGQDKVRIASAQPLPIQPEPFTQPPGADAMFPTKGVRTQTHSIGQPKDSVHLHMPRSI